MTGRLRRPRWWAKLRAGAGGYFWIACPLCGREFGGQEWAEPDGFCSTIPTECRGIGTAICPVCTAEGRGCALHRCPEPGRVHRLSYVANGPHGGLR